MDNRITGLELRDASVVPATAEVWVRARTDYVSPSTELRGRLMGPSCLFASTVEVGYPLRPFARLPEDFGAPCARAAIPEASLWDPQSPFLYHGAIELWQDSRLCQRVTLSHGLRTLALGQRGLFVNGRRLVLRGRSVTTLTEPEALSLRDAGINLLVAPVTATTAPLWELADRVGFFVLGELESSSAATTVPAIVAAAHASCLGWLVRTEYAGPTPVGGFVGLLADRRRSTPQPHRIDFVVTDAEELDLDLPALVRGPRASDAAGVLGTFV
jgi:hypothetical protein